MGDGALGFWGALEEIYPETRAQRGFVHKTANVLSYLPKSVQLKAKSALYEIWMAATRTEAERAFDRFVVVYPANYPKATRCLTKDRESLLSVYDFPAEHWVHIRSTNPIESTFATIRHRSDRAKGCVSRATMLALIYKLGMSAEKRWQRLCGFQLLAKVIAGVPFRDGVEDLTPSEDSAQGSSKAAA
jgi:putative transposase